jgi:hypothetical protein
VNTRPYLILRTGFFAQDKTLLAVSIEPSQARGYEGQRISDASISRTFDDLPHPQHQPRDLRDRQRAERAARRRSPERELF